MKTELIKTAEDKYRVATEKATAYFQTLYEQVRRKEYVHTLTQDLEAWKMNHIRKPSVMSSLSKGNIAPTSTEYHAYIKWLDYTGKLDNYLDRSMSYIYMRDLGLSLESEHNIASVNRAVNRIKKHVTTNNDNSSNDTFSMVGMYRLAQKKGVELTIIWLFSKLKIISANLPNEMDGVQAQRKILKIIAGVLLHVEEEMEEDIPFSEKAKRLDKAIRLGYCYGLTYPFIDDLLDAKILSKEEEKHYAELIRTTLLTGSVPEWNEWKGTNNVFIRFVHSELTDAFEYMKNNQRPESLQTFLEQSYLFFHSQEVDREKNLSNENYTNEELYIPVILKSSSSRSIVRTVLDSGRDPGFERRTFYYGIYNQLADDFADMFEDLEEGAVTPYTYYLKYHSKRPDLINPFEMYWTVISYLIHQVYHSDSKTCEVILDRAINGLKRYREKMGKDKYKEVMDLFVTDEPVFRRVIDKLVRKADDVDFFDKLLRDHMITELTTQRKDQKAFLKTMDKVRNIVNSQLRIKENNHDALKDSIVEAANYSLTGDGKRLRPILTWVMGVDEYGLDKNAIIPLLKSIEYMHTASLIFDDLPSQDNASIRRGRPTLHETYNKATAELTGLFLTQKATEEQASLETFDPKAVLKMIQYSSFITAEMCKGQAMDLESRGKRLNLEQLNTLCFYKTGIGFEASLIMPAILAKASEEEIKCLKKYAYHAGIAFQIKDDLLDAEGNALQLGKPAGQDAENNTSTFVSILGIEDAKKEMWEHYCLAIEALAELPRNTGFLKQLLGYMVNRDY